MNPRIANFLDEQIRYLAKNLSFPEIFFESDVESLRFEIYLMLCE